MAFLKIAEIVCLLLGATVWGRPTELGSNGTSNFPGRTKK